MLNTNYGIGCIRFLTNNMVYGLLMFIVTHMGRREMSGMENHSKAFEHVVSPF